MPKRQINVECQKVRCTIPGHDYEHCKVYVPIINGVPLRGPYDGVFPSFTSAKKGAARALSVPVETVRLKVR